MFCREQIAQLRDITTEVHQRGARLLAIGSGKPAQAKAFAEERELDFDLYTDPGLRAYRAAGLRRDVASTFNLGLVKHGVRALKTGFRQGMTQGDPWQQGGAFVFAPGDEVLFEQRSDTAGDHVDPRQLLDALP
jgi:hypothetical protein